MSNSNEAQLRKTLAKIAELAGAAAGNGSYESHEDHEHEVDANGTVVCVPKALPERLLLKSAQTAVEINPVNAPQRVAIGQFAAAQVFEPAAIAVLTQKYWGPSTRRLTVSFMETPAANLRARIVSHLNSWSKTAGISFVETSSTGTIRISRGGSGYWSYLGTDVLLIPKNRPTMNLQGFTMSTSESEYKRVVRHEAGHTLGMPHEHMRKALIARIDKQKAYAYFLQTYGWDKATVDAQVLTPLDEANLMSTPPDQTSIMCYQLPGSITKDGKPILGGMDINATDYTFAGKVYPKASASLTSESLGDDWNESDDVEDVAYPD
jgi:hypothetical protein